MALMQGVIGANEDGQDQRLLRADKTTHAIKTIEYPHSEIHEENGYLIVHSELQDTAGTIEVLLETALTATRAHMTVHLNAALAATAELWIDSVKTQAIAYDITPLNRDFESIKTSIITACHTPAGVQLPATASITQFIGSASASGRSDVGGDGGSRAEFKLARDSAYLFRLTSRADNNALTMTFDWYEHTDKS